MNEALFREAIEAGQRGDETTAEAKLTELLKVDIRNLPAMLLMADIKVRAGDERAASQWYQAALGQAAILQNVPQQLHPMLAQGQEFLTKANLKFESHLIESISSTGAATSARVDAAIDLLLGRKELYLQQPSSFYFPGLPQRQFYEREEFDWLDEFEARAPEMLAELESLLLEQDEFSPYVEATPGRPQPNNPLRDDPSWGAHYFWQNGEQVIANADRAPATMAALASAPQPIIDKRSPMALYSILKPGTHIQAHHGLLNTRLICHVPLIAPAGCRLRVGNEAREWRFGETLIFDDSIEHEAWNDSDEIRIVLLFEIWRPEINEEERAALTALFEAITDYSGVSQDAG